jgi:phage gpG-like protein
MQETFEFDRSLAQLEAAFRRLPNGVATVAVNFFKERFRAQNWVGDHTEPWKPRKNSPHWARKGERGSRRAILVKTGRLRRSIRKISAMAEQVVIGTDVPYAQIHNEGYRGPIEQQVKAHTRHHTTFGITGRRELRTRTRITYGRVRTGDTSEVRAHTRRIRVNIPRRQFIGQSVALNRQIERFITAELMRALKP